jgi:hypothetical protein
LWFDLKEWLSCVLVLFEGVAHLCVGFILKEWLSCFLYVADEENLPFNWFKKVKWKVQVLELDGDHVEINAKGEISPSPSVEQCLYACQFSSLFRPSLLHSKSQNDHGLEGIETLIPFWEFGGDDECIIRICVEVEDSHSQRANQTELTLAELNDMLLNVSCYDITAARIG